MIRNKILYLTLLITVLSALFSFHVALALSKNNVHTEMKASLNIDIENTNFVPQLKTTDFYSEKGKSFQKSWGFALLLCIFVGFLGAHRFYLGYTWQGIIQLLTLGGFGIWIAIDLVRLLFKKLKPANLSSFKQ